MPQPPSSIPPSDSGKKPEGSLPSKTSNTPVNPEEFQANSGEYKYLNFTFTSKKAYIVFKAKFLTNMVNMMIRQIKQENERMIKALKKMREQG